MDLGYVIEHMALGGKDVFGSIVIKVMDADAPTGVARGGAGEAGGEAGVVEPALPFVAA